MNLYTEEQLIAAAKAGSDAVAAKDKQILDTLLAQLCPACKSHVLEALMDLEVGRIA